MKYLDRVKIISNEYEKFGIYYGDEGHILSAEIRDGKFEFFREDPITFADDINAEIKIEHLKLVKSSDITDNEILNALAGNNPNWWCKVEDGYILNLNGKKKNKIAYKYDS